jgi:hypothetical protein
VLLGAGDEQYGYAIAVHHAEVVLLVVDFESKGVAVVCDRGGYIGEGEFG